MLKGETHNHEHRDRKEDKAMTNDNDARKAHKILDDLFNRKPVLDEEREFLRNALPELPKQKTLEEIVHDVYEAWIASSGDEWIRDGVVGSVISLEDWLKELHTQLKGIAPAKPAHPEFLETEAGYQRAPEGTIVVVPSRVPWAKVKSGDWVCRYGTNSDFSMALDGRRQVLRWGWGE